MTLRFLIVAVTTLALSAAAVAHHSVPVNFDSSRTVIITGALTEIAWLNPHSRFRLDVTQVEEEGKGVVKTDDGSTEAWLVEMGAINTMRRAGFETERFAVGDAVTITGSPGRREAHTMILREVTLADGSTLSP